MDNTWDAWDVTYKNNADDVLVTKKGWVSGSKWSGISDGLREGAMAFNLDIVLEKESGLLKETVYYTVTGKCDKVKAFQKIVEKCGGKSL
jgi:hypothetical protein